MVPDHTMNEYFAENNRYDVNLFGNFDEGMLNSGCQFNYINGDGGRQRSNKVA